jgi:hypothetical protein
MEKLVRSATRRNSTWVPLDKMALPDVFSKAGAVDRRRRYITTRFRPRNITEILSVGAPTTKKKVSDAEGSWEVGCHQSRNQTCPSVEDSFEWKG